MEACVEGKRKTQERSIEGREGFKDCDMVIRVRRMRTEKRPLNLAALGVNGPAEGITSKNKNSGPQSGGANTPSKPRDGPGVVELSTSPGCAISSGRGDINGEWREVMAWFALTEEANQKWKKS